MLNALAIQDYLTKYVNFLSGKVNQKYPLIGYVFSYDPNITICAGCRRGQLRFYPLNIIKEFDGTPFQEMKSWLIQIAVHELSHIDQDIDYDKYSTDIEYKKAIEEANENHTIEWIQNNLNILHKAFPDITDLPLWRGSNSTKFGVSVSNNEYQICKTQNLMHNMLIKYLSDAVYYPKVTIRIITDQINNILIKDNGIWNSDIIPELISIMNFIELNFSKISVKMDTEPDNPVGVIVTFHPEDIIPQNICYRNPLLG